MILFIFQKKLIHKKDIVFKKVNFIKIIIIKENQDLTNEDFKNTNTIFI